MMPLFSPSHHSFNVVETFEEIDVPLFLLGDSACSLSHWLMEPYPEGRGVTAEQIKFNHRLSQARMTVEQWFSNFLH